MHKLFNYLVIEVNKGTIRLPCKWSVATKVVDSAVLLFDSKSGHPKASKVWSSKHPKTDVHSFPARRSTSRALLAKENNKITKYILVLKGQLNQFLINP